MCQHDPKVNTVFNSNMLDVKVQIRYGFYSIQAVASCDVGWFMVDNLCINFYKCIKCTNNAEADKLCNKHGGQLAHRVLNNVTISTPRNALDNHTELSLFWDMFHHIEDIIPSLNHKSTFTDFLDKEVQKFIAVNGSERCPMFNMSTSALTIITTVCLIAAYKTSAFANAMTLILSCQ